MKRARDESLFLAWHTAYLTAYAPQKPNKFIKLEELIGPSRPSSRQMAPEEIEAVTRSWLGGRKQSNVEAPITHTKAMKVR